MSINFEFGRQVKKAREDLSMTQKRLAQLLGIELFRLKNGESGQTDEVDFTEEELMGFSRILRRPLCWLLHGKEKSHKSRCELEVAASESRLREGVIAQRSHTGPRQEEIAFWTGTCPYCHRYPSSGSSRCDKCGHALD